MDTVLITGCSSGFGRETAAHFLAQGWNVVATMRDPSANTLPPSDRLRVLPLDVTDADSITATEEDFDAAYRVHVKGPFFLTQALLPLIADGGRIVNISSGLTRIIYPGRIAYGAMKGAVEVMTRYMAKELGPRRIAVNTVAPGAIQTDFSGGVVRDNPEVARHIAEVTALGRPGLPNDIGPMIASLLSEDNRWVNAQRIEVSGGQAI